MRAALALPGLDHATARRAMLAALEFRPFPDAAPALRELRAAGLPPRGGEQLGLLAAGVAAPRRPARAWWTAWSRRRWWAPPSPIRRRSGAPSSWPAPEPARGAARGRLAENDVEGARAAGVRAVLVARGGTAAAGRGVGALARRGRLPNLRADGQPWPLPARPAGAAGGGRAALAGVVRRGGLPGGAQRPRWWPWGSCPRITGVDTEEDDATFTIVATLIQSAIFVGTAVLFASFTRKPKAVALRPAPDPALAGGGLGRARDRSPSTCSRRSTRWWSSRTPSRRWPRTWGATRAPSA